MKTGEYCTVCERYFGHLVLGGVCANCRNAARREANDNYSGLVDGNGNEITVHETGYVLDGEDCLCVLLRGQSETGYVVTKGPQGAFGNEDCPSSYDMPCVAWFGSEEKYANAKAVLMAMGAVKTAWFWGTTMYGDDGWIGGRSGPFASYDDAKNDAVSKGYGEDSHLTVRQEVI